MATSLPSPHGRTVSYTLHSTLCAALEGDVLDPVAPLAASEGQTAAHCCTLSGWHGEDLEGWRRYICIWVQVLEIRAANECALRDMQAQCHRNSLLRISAYIPTLQT